MRKLLIANRGEIAIRVMRAAAELGMETVAVCAADDTACRHVMLADHVVPLKTTGPAAYLDQEGIIAAALHETCDAIHPGYGFLSENADFCRRCIECGIVFIGPEPETLQLFSNKAAARSLARRCDVPVLPGSEGAVTLEEAIRFMESRPGEAVMLKAVSGGGGRGMREVTEIGRLEEAFARCRSEALSAFGNDELYIERRIPHPRHIEIQIAGDGEQVIHLGERDCTLQRRNQKLLEIAPCPSLPASLRAALIEASLKMARETGYRSLGTVEYLVERENPEAFHFMEVNPRLQVEHTVTEEWTGVDLVRTQLQIAAGKSLAELGLPAERRFSTGYALQVRINMEKMDEHGNTTPQSGTLSVYEAPTGKDIRVDGYGYGGYTVNPAFDSLLAKLTVVSSSSRFEDVVKKAARALSEFRIRGVETNIPFLAALLERPEIMENRYDTRFVEDNAAALVRASTAYQDAGGEGGSAGRPFDDAPGTGPDPVPPGMSVVRTAMQGRVVAVCVEPGDTVVSGQKLAVLEAMKMEHVVQAETSGIVYQVLVHPNDVVPEGRPLLFFEEAEIEESADTQTEQVDPDAVRPDLSEVFQRHAFTLDENRIEAVAKRRAKGQRTARENVLDLCDSGSFIEYGALIVAAQRRVRSLDELMQKTPADGLITGIGTVNRALFGEKRSRCMVMAYDYTVLAGTQGMMNHKKTDRVLKLANQWRLPLILLAEGGGGRPSDTDIDMVAGLDLPTFSRFAALSGKAPLIGIVEGRCFAGNAVLLGCCDVIIATRNANIGMGGPAMIEGGGLGRVRPEEIGPTAVQTRNGVVDLAVAGEQEAVAAAKAYLSYFQGRIENWEAGDQRRLRSLVPENRLRVFDVRKIIETIGDNGSFLELRRHFAPGMITGLIRIEGHPFGLVANNNAHMSGAIQAGDADKAARFIQLCNAHGLPILSLCDTPGFMVGPEVEKQAQVRHACRMFVAGAKVTVPWFTIVLRKGYGLGAMAMAAGGFHDAVYTVSWPTGEFGGMGLEGAVRHALKKELAAIADEAEREATFQFFVKEAYARGKAVNMASYMEIDAVIDPVDTRRWIVQGLHAAEPGPESGFQSRFIDTW